MVLSSFEYFIQQVCWGSLISGFIIFFLTLFLQGTHIFDSDHDIDHDVSGGIDHDIDHDFSADLDHDIDIGDHDASFDHDHDVDSDGAAPLMLLAATFMLTFGGLGVVLFGIAMETLSRLAIIFIIPIGTTYLVSRVWHKVAISEIYETALERVKINAEVKTITAIDEKGGICLVYTDSTQGPIKIFAKTRYGEIPKDSNAYVVEIQKSHIIIEEFPIEEPKEKSNYDNEGKISWEE